MKTTENFIAGSPYYTYANLFYMVTHVQLLRKRHRLNAL